VINVEITNEVRVVPLSQQNMATIRLHGAIFRKLAHLFSDSGINVSDEDSEFIRLSYRLANEHEELIDRIWGAGIELHDFYEAYDDFYEWANRYLAQRMESESLEEEYA